MNTPAKIKLFRAALRVTYPFALLFIYPFAMLSKKNKGHLFFFFDRYLMGGAPAAHLNILRCIPDMHKQVYFTRTSSNERHKNDFYQLANTDVREIQKWCENILFRLFSVHYYAFYINRHQKGHVFSSNCTFFYDMLPFFSKHVITTELLHSFSNEKNGMELFGLANYKYITNRIVIDHKTYANIRRQYEEYKVDSAYFDRVRCIENSVDVPEHIIKDYSLPLKILYAGRGGYEKRIDRIDRIARQCIERQLPVEFHFAGDESLWERLSGFVKDNSVMHGSITKTEQMYDLYMKCHVVIITSIFEGFPMVVKEGMACGCIPLITALEGMMYHLKHKENALILFCMDDEDKLVQEGIENIISLVNDSTFLKQLSESSYKYASVHFNKQEFTKTYREFFK